MQARKRACVRNCVSQNLELRLVPSSRMGREISVVEITPGCSIWVWQLPKEHTKMKFNMTRMGYMEWFLN